MLHGGSSSALQRKFRIWRCDIPRDNVEIRTNKPPVPPASASAAVKEAYRKALAAYNQYMADCEHGVFRTKARPNDRLRNPWLYLKLQKDAAEEGETLPKTEVHDVVMTYFE